MGTTSRKMLRLAVLLVAVAAVKAWGENDCGYSMYEDAGREGDSRTRMIVGGWESRENEFPWQISLQWFGSHICGGSVVDSRHVITAAHCVENDAPSRLSVVVGDHRRN